MLVSLKEYLFIFFATILLTTGFYSNAFDTAEENYFRTFQNDDESFILGRLAISERNGIFSYGGLNGRVIFPEITDNLEKYNIQYSAYFGEKKIDKRQFGPYLSQTAGQAMLFSTLSAVSPFENSTNYTLFRLLNSILSALLFSIFLVWVNREFGILTSVICLFFLLVSPWLTIFGDNLWWVIWAFYTPFVTLLFLFQNESKNYNKPVLSLKRIALTAYLGILFKCFFNGFEYISTVLVMITIPAFYYAVLGKWNRFMFFKRFLAVAIAAILAIVTSFLILIYQISIIKGSFAEGVKHIVFSYTKRASSVNDDLPEVFNQSLKAPLSDVIQKYWNMTALDFNSWTDLFWNSFLKIDFGELIVIFLLFSALGLISKHVSPTSFKNHQKNKALLTATWISLLAPLSWFVVFKGHSFIHVHMNAIVWYMPFCLLGFTMIASVVSSISKDLFNRYKNLKKVFKTFIKITIAVLLLIIIGSSIRDSIKTHKKYTSITQQENLLFKNDDYQLYLVGRQLWYLKDSSSNNNFNSLFFLHIIPEDTIRLAEDRRVHGFANLDFKYNPTEILDLPWWSSESNHIIFYRQLPFYDIKFIQTGQYNKDGRLWESGAIFFDKGQ